MGGVTVPLMLVLNIILNVMGGSVTFAYSVICFCLHFDSFCAKHLQLFGV